jgi:hypothetical protein
MLCFPNQTSRVLLVVIHRCTLDLIRVAVGRAALGCCGLLLSRHGSHRRQEQKQVCIASPPPL